MDNNYNIKILISLVLILIVFVMTVIVFQSIDKDLIRKKPQEKKESVTENFDQYKIDTDGDGLSDASENVFYTDINKTDTDGDGYSDKDELERGYNPLGEGDSKSYSRDWWKMRSERFVKEKSKALAAKPAIETSIARDDRLRREALASGNKKTCKEIKDDIKERGCIYDIILQEQGYADCDKMLEVEKRETCQKNIKYSREVCDQLPSGSTRNICYKEGAVVFENISFCDELKTIDKYEHKEFCIINYAYLVGDLSVCEAISDTRLNRMCLSPSFN